MANITKNFTLQSLHDVVFEIEKSPEDKYIQIKEGQISVTTNRQQKASFEEIAKLITSLKFEAFKNGKDLKMYAETVEHFRNIEQIQHDTGFWSFFHFESKAESDLKNMHPVCFELERLMNSSLTSEQEVSEFLKNSKLRNLFLSYVNKELMVRFEKAVNIGLTESEAIAFLIYSSGAYKTINATLRDQDAILEEEVPRNQDRAGRITEYEFGKEKSTGNKVGPVRGSPEEVLDYYKLEAKLIAKYTNKALEKLEKYEGDLWRGDILSDEELKSFELGEFSDRAFMSFSTEREISEAFSLRDTTNVQEKHRVVIRVISKTGRLTSELSNSPEEKEVTYKSGQRFKVEEKQPIHIKLDYGEKREGTVRYFVLTEI